MNYFNDEYHSFDECIDDYQGYDKLCLALTYLYDLEETELYEV